jgi:thiol-disulfide isomerase/thioredoxin
VNLYDKYAQAKTLSDFISEYGSASDQNRWRAVYEQVQLTHAQRQLLGRFRREVPVLVLAGAWCGDCVRQCPIFQHFEAAAPVMKIRYLDRDVHADVQKELSICGGNRVPVVVFFSEDGYEVARFGERTLATYRNLVDAQTGEVGPSGASHDSLLEQVTQDWLDIFERVQWLLRLSPRLRQKHGD